MLDKLLYSAQGGSDEALREIVNRFQPLVLATCGRLYDGGDWPDYVQEGNLALVEAVFSFNPRGKAPFPWYARQRVYYGVFNYHRRLRREGERELLTLNGSPQGEEVVSPIDLVPGGAINPEEAVLRREDYYKVRRALAGLPEKQRRVIFALHFENRRLIDVAEELGIRPSSVKGLENRAFKNLRQALAHHR